MLCAFVCVGVPNSCKRTKFMHNLKKRKTFTKCFIYWGFRNYLLQNSQFCAYHFHLASFLLVYDICEVLQLSNLLRNFVLLKFTPRLLNGSFIICLNIRGLVLFTSPSSLPLSLILALSWPWVWYKYLK